MVNLPFFTNESSYEKKIEDIKIFIYKKFIQFLVIISLLINL